MFEICTGPPKINCIKITSTLVKERIYKVDIVHRRVAAYSVDSDAVRFKSAFFTGWDVSLEQQ